MKTLAAVIGLSLIAFAGAAYADPVDTGERAVPVRYKDLNLDRPEDAAMMMSRLNYAAYKACSVGETSSAAAKRAAEACRRDAVQAAVKQIGAPELAKLYAARYETTTR